MNVVVRFVDLGITVSLIVMLVYMGRRLCRHGWRMRTGFQITLLSFSALSLHTMSRIVAWPEGPLSNGYIFSVLGRVGLLFLLVGIEPALERKDDRSHNTETKAESENIHDDTPSEGTTFLRSATAVPLEAV